MILSSAGASRVLHFTSDNNMELCLGTISPLDEVLQVLSRLRSFPGYAGGFQIRTYIAEKVRCSQLVLLLVCFAFSLRGVLDFRLLFDDLLGRPFRSGLLLVLRDSTHQP